MKYVLLIQASPTSAAAVNAVKFAEALLMSEHELLKVFFYGEAVATANCLQTPPQDEFHLYSKWGELFTSYGISGTVCIAAGLKRGVVDQPEAERYQIPNFNLQKPFILAGLGELIEASTLADRVVTFR